MTETTAVQTVTQPAPTSCQAFVVAFIEERRRRLELAEREIEHLRGEIEHLRGEIEYWDGVRADCAAWLAKLDNGAHR